MPSVRRSLLGLISIFCLLASITVSAGASSTRSSYKNKVGKKRIFTYEAMDEYNQEKQKIEVVVEPTSTAKLEKFSPENIPQFLEERRTKASDFKSRMGYGALLRHTAYEFPKESAVFFAGVGGVLILEMLTQYEKNPMALMQQIESLKNPVGHFSFYMFMYANRISMSFWPKLVKNPALWSYLGMTVGMLASDITTEILEPLRPCALDLLKEMKEKKGVMPPSCSTAYKDLVLSDKLLDMAPSLTSMLLSTWLAGTIQTRLMQTLSSQALAQISKQYFKWDAVNVLEFFAPGGVPTKLSRVMLKLSQISLFIGIEHHLNPIVKKHWNNLARGLGLASSTRQLTDDLLKMKANGWTESSMPDRGEKCLEKENKEICYRGFAKELVEFREQMAHWRQANLEPVRMAHESWNMKLAKLSAAFDGSFDVYSHIINEILISKQGQFSPIDEGDPYFGIKPYIKDGSEFPAEGFLDGALQTQIFQRERLKVGARKIAEELDAYKKRSLLNQVLSFLSLGAEKKELSLPPSLHKLARVGELWEAKDENRMFNLIKKFRDGIELIDESELSDLRKALLVKNEESFVSFITTPTEERTEEQNQIIMDRSLDWFMRERAKMVEGTRLFAGHFELALGSPKKYSADVQAIYEKIENEVGRPKPTAEPGRAYLRNFALHPQYGHYFELIDYPKNPGHYRLETPAEYFLHQMICGPEAEAGAPLVKLSWMSYDQFIPPQVRSTDHSMENFCRYEPFGVNRTMYSNAIVIKRSNGEEKSFKGVISYLKENIRETVLDPSENKNSLKDWWEKNVSPQIDSVFAHYADDYQKVIEQFRDVVMSKQSDRGNMGPVFNSPVWAIQQEARFYLLVISELLKDLGTFSDDQQVLWGESPKSFFLSKDLTSYPGVKLPLFSILKFNGPYHLTGMSRILPRLIPQLTNDDPKGELILVRQFDEEFSKLTQLTTTLGSSPETKEAISAQYAASSSQLSEIFDQLKALATDEGVISKLAERQRLVLEQALEGLESVQKELTSYQLIVSLLSRDVQGKVEDNNCRAIQNRAGKLTLVCPE